MKALKIVVILYGLLLCGVLAVLAHRTFGTDTWKNFVVIVAGVYVILMARKALKSDGRDDE